jgi:hypothetical protein
MSANEDIKARRGAADVADRFFESTDFTANEQVNTITYAIGYFACGIQFMDVLQATMYRRHSCHVEDKPAATLHQVKKSFYSYSSHRLTHLLFLP